MPKDIDDLRDEIADKLGSAGSPAALVSTLREADFADVSPKQVGEATQVIDFTIEAPGPGFETRDLHSSSIVIGPDNRPRSFVMRFPVVLVGAATGHSPREVSDAMGMARETVRLPTRQWMERSPSSVNPHIESTEGATLPGGEELGEAIVTMRDVFFEELLERTIWLELRVTQGHDFSPEETEDVTRLIEDTIAQRRLLPADQPVRIEEGVYKVTGREAPTAREIFCATERNIMRCLIRIDRDRIPVRRLETVANDLLRAFQQEPNRSIDEINVVDPEIAETALPEQRRPEMDFPDVITGP